MEIDNNFTYLDPQILENLSREETKYLEVSKQIAKDVQSSKLTILDVIQRLSCVLLDLSVPKRDLGVLLLSQTLHNLENGNLNPEELSVLSSYFDEKLKDQHQVATTALKGVLALVNFSNIPQESVIKLISSIFNHVICQQQQQQDRYLIFQIYETILKQHVDVVNSMDIDFVYGVISSIDGERDPKNINYLFDWLQVFLKTVKLGHLTEEMFEVLSCYFPVDFKAPPSNKNGVTREDLAQGLCKCLTCIPDFGQYAIPLALEKLESALQIAKEDSLDILNAGCKTYETQLYYQHSIEIWSQIQKEIFNTSNNDFKNKCLETLKEIISKLSHGDQKNFENSVIDIADTLTGNLLPDSKLHLKSSQILLHVARANELSSLLVAKRTCPLLENTFKITKDPKHKAIILHNFVEFIKAIIETNTKVNLTSLEEITSCPVLCSHAILEREPELIVEGYRGFTAIIPFISEDWRQICLQNLNEALATPLQINIKQAVLELLKTLAESFPQEVEKHVLRNEVLCDIVAIDNYLEALSSIISLTYFEDYVINTFIGYTTTNSVAKSIVALNHLKGLSKSHHISEVLVRKDFLTRFIDFLININEEESSARGFLSGVNSVLQNIIRNQEFSLQKDIYLAQSKKKFKMQNLYVTVLSGLIIPLQRRVFEDFEKIDLLLEYGLNAADEFTRTISLEVLANVLNKIDNESVLEDKLNKIKLSCDNCNTDTKVWIISWVTKSLVTRNHGKAWLWTEMLLNSLQDNLEAAKGFRIIMNENCSAISKENYCQIMPLYRQKFFVYCTNKLNVIPQNDGSAHLNAVGYLIENAPKLAVIGHFKKILRLILLCLENCNEPTVLVILLQRITEFIISGESVIEDNLEDILLRILNLTTFETAMTVRIAAVRCLHQITVSYKVYQLLPHRPKVIQRLGICVDDRKRLVRREAMECRSLWYLLDSPS